jgi:hypothetical protein
MKKGWESQNRTLRLTGTKGQVLLVLLSTINAYTTASTSLTAYTTAGTSTTAAAANSCYC